MATDLHHATEVDVTEVFKEVEYKTGKTPIPIKMTLPAAPGTVCTVGVVLAHGAGGDMDSGHLPRLAESLASSFASASASGQSSDPLTSSAGTVPAPNPRPPEPASGQSPGSGSGSAPVHLSSGAAPVAVVRFTCKPPHLPTRVAAFQAVLRAATAWPETSGVRVWIAAGHSMGGRAACQVAYDSARQAQHRREPRAEETGRDVGGESGGSGGKQQQARQLQPAQKEQQQEQGQQEVTEPASKRRRRTSASSAGKNARPDGTAAAPLSTVSSGSAAATADGDKAPAGLRTRAAAAAARAEAAATAAETAAVQKVTTRAGTGAVEGSGGASTKGQRGSGREATRAADANASAAAAAAAAAPAEGLPPVAACVLLSYPLHPPGKPHELRDDPLCSLRCPLLWVRGSRDEFCTPAPFQAVRGRMSCSRLQVYTVEGGDHGLSVPRGHGGGGGSGGTQRRKSGKGGEASGTAEGTEAQQAVAGRRGELGREQEAALEGVFGAVAAFVQEVARSPVTL